MKKILCDFCGLPCTSPTRLVLSFFTESFLTPAARFTLQNVDPAGQTTIWDCCDVCNGKIEAQAAASFGIAKAPVI